MTKINSAILLLGGKGSRLKPITLSVNKHMLPIYNQPLALVAVEFLLKLGIKKIITVINPEDIERYKRLFEMYRNKLIIELVAQKTSLGTAHAIKLCEKKLEGEKYFATYWGDNVFEFADKQLLQTELGPSKARIFITSVIDPENYGVIEIKNNKIISIEDKPKKPKSNFACTGFMLFSHSVFEKIDQIYKNENHEWDIMDVIRSFHKKGSLDYQHIKGRWFDAGVSPESLFQVSKFARKHKINKTND